MVEHSHVGIHVVQVIGIRWVFHACPVLWKWSILVKYYVLRLRFIIDRIKTSYLTTRKTVLVKLTKKIKKNSCIEMIWHKINITLIYNDMLEQV